MDSDRDPDNSPEPHLKPDAKPELPHTRPVSAAEAADAPPEETAGAEDDDEARLPEPAEELSDETFEAETFDELGESRLAGGHAAIERAVRLAPTSPGVYRMLNAASDVLYVGKAKNVRKRLTSYA